MRKKQPLNSLLGLLVLVPLASSTAGNKSFKFRFIFWRNNTNNIQKSAMVWFFQDLPFKAGFLF